MTAPSTPPDDAANPATPPGAAESGPVSLHKQPDAASAVAPADGQPELDFDPYRFGAPEHPVPPEYAPPGYRPPVPTMPAAPPAPGGSYPGAYPGVYPPPPPAMGQPYPPTPYPPTPWGQYPPPPAGHGKAVAALSLGIGSIVLCWLSIFDAALVILALIFGSLALGEVRRDPRRGGRGMAIAGIVCAVVGAVLAVAITVYVYNRFKDCLDLTPGSAEYKTCITDHL